MENAEIIIDLDSSIERGKRLRILRRAIRLSRADIEQRYGVSAATQKNWENARFGGLTETGAKKMIKVFEKQGLYCPIEWLLWGKGDDPLAKKDFQRFDIHQFAFKASDNIEDEDSAIKRELQLFYQQNPGSIDYILGDESMSPLLQPGDLVAGVRYFQPTDIPLHLYHKYPCIVQSEPGGTLVRMVEVQSNHLYTLHCANPHFVTLTLKDVKLISIAPILWIRRKRK